MATDIVLSFFATPGGNAASATRTNLQDLIAVSQPVALLSNPTVLVGEWPMDPTKQHTGMFRAFAEKARDPVSKRILPNLVAQARKQKGISGPIGRIAVIDFSAGRCMASEILQHADDRASVDTVIDMDGLNLVTLWNGSIDPGTRRSDGTFATGWAQGGVGTWSEFGRLALDGSHLLVNWHTDIPAPVGGGASTTAANALLYQMLSDMVAQGATAQSQAYDPATLAAGPPPPAVYTPAQNDDARTWDAMPPLDIQDVGNCHRIRMPGNRGGAHIFSCYWGQGAVWRTFLVPRWNDPSMRCASPTGVNGLGRAFGQVPRPYALLTEGATLFPWTAVAAGLSGPAMCVIPDVEGGDAPDMSDDDNVEILSQPDEGGPGLWDSIVDWGTGILVGDDAMTTPDEPTPDDGSQQSAVMRSATVLPTSQAVLAAALKREAIKPIVGVIAVGVLLFGGYKLYKYAKKS